VTSQLFEWGIASGTAIALNCEKHTTLLASGNATATTQLSTIAHFLLKGLQTHVQLEMNIYMVQ